jgi:hypothetical protein
LLSKTLQMILRRHCPGVSPRVWMIVDGVVAVRQPRETRDGKCRSVRVYAAYSSCLPTQHNIKTSRVDECKGGCSQYLSVGSILKILILQNIVNHTFSSKMYYMRFSAAFAACFDSPMTVEMCATRWLASCCGIQSRLSLTLRTSTPHTRRATHPPPWPKSWVSWPALGPSSKH